MPTVLLRATWVTCLTLITTLFAHLQMRKHRRRGSRTCLDHTAKKQGAWISPGLPDAMAHSTLSYFCMLKSLGCLLLFLLLPYGKDSRQVRGASQTQWWPSPSGTTSEWMLRKERPHLDSAQRAVGTCYKVSPYPISRTRILAVLRGTITRTHSHLSQ